MAYKLGTTTKVAVGSGGAADWENTFPAAVHVRLVGDVAFNVAVGEHGEVAATVDDCYVGEAYDIELALAVGDSLSFATAEDEGNVWVTVVWCS